jgi:CysZ protein
MKLAQDFVSGMGKPFEGVKILFGNSKYFKYVWVSALLNMILYLLVLYLIFYFIFPWINSLFSAYVSSGFLSFIYSTIECLMKILIFLTLLVLFVLLFNIIFFAISAPYLDGLSTAIEKDFFGFTSPSSGIKSFPKACYISIRNGMRLNFLALLWTILLFPLNFMIPIFGFLPGMLVSSYFLGLSFLIFCAEHRFLNKKEFSSKLNGHRATVFGFGLTMYGILFIPFSAAIFIPGGVIGATLLYNDKIEQKTDNKISP